VHRSLVRFIACWVCISANPFPCTYSKSGPKTERAEEWGIPIVNHLWVEECFKRWAFVHPAAESGRFVSYPPGINYAEILGQRGIGNVRREALDLEDDAPNLQQSKKISRTGNAMDLDSEGPIASTSKAASPKKLAPEPVASNTSSAAEVEKSASKRQDPVNSRLLPECIIRNGFRL